MAHSRESLWLWACASLVATGAALVALAGAMDAANAGFGLWSSAPMIGAYAVMTVAVASFVAAVRDWPFPFAADRPGHTLPHAGGDGRGEANDAAPGGGQVVVGEIPREPLAFVEREALSKLAEVAERGRVAVVCAVTGLRGVGKTQLAAAYARTRISEGWGLVGWVNADSRDSMLADMARVADAMGVADPDGDSLESARRLRAHLETRIGHGLVVFDNAADPDVLRPFLPAAGSTQVVITSVDRAFTELGTAVDVVVYSRSESLAYLAERTTVVDHDGAEAVASELADLPLGLAQAAATIAGQKLSYLEYLKQLRRVPVGQLLGRVQGGDYPRSCAAALLLNVQAAEANDPSGLTSRLLRIVAALSPDGVRREVVEGLAAAGLGGPGNVDAAAARCVAWSLLTWSVAGDAVIMHRLLGRVLRERDLASGQWTATVSECLDVLEPLLFPEDEAWARRQEGAHLAAQAEALWEAGTAIDAGDPSLVRRQLQAKSWAVQQLRAAADLSRAIGLGERTLADRERVLGPDHPDTLTSRSELAYAYESAGRVREAIDLYEATLADRERVLGPDHLDTLTSRNNLASAYEAAGRVSEAIPLFERALAHNEQVQGQDHIDTLTSRNNLAYAYLSAGRVSEAIPLFERVLADRDRLLGPDHPDTLTSRNNLAYAYDSAGRVSEAINLYKATLADRDRLLGADHPDTLTSRNNLAYAYDSAGRVSEAINLYKATLADRDRLLGADHPDTLASRSNLATAYASAGRVSEAIDLHEATLADCERVLGPDHLQTLTLRNNLAYAYESAGRVGEAIPLFQRVVADSERLLGPDHPDTLTSRNDLAEAYDSAGRVGEEIGDR
jgi:tetratricopeptide (TPR) repeat protein